MGPIEGAATWLGELFFGPLTAAIAVVAIGWLGFRMLEGRMPVRAGLATIVGIFIIFGAPSIAASVIDIARQDVQTPHAESRGYERPKQEPPEPENDISPYARPSV